MSAKKKVPLLFFLKRILVVGTILSVGVLAGIYFTKRLGSDKNTNPAPGNKHLAFTFEVYDKIQENYWEKISEEELVNLYVLGIEKLVGQPQNIKKSSKNELGKLLSNTLDLIDSESKKDEFTANLSDIVLANLKPFGRSRLYSQKDEKALSKNVKNITDTDHYKILGISKDSSQEEIAQTFEKKEKELAPKAAQDPEAKKELDKIAKAYEVLKDKETRKTYDTAGIEPTMSYQLLSPEIFYLQIKKFSPTTFDELKRVTEKVDQGNTLDTLILDLRDNIGGAIDGLPYFLGPFIGQDQYAYQFYHQGEKEDYKTRTGWLPSLVRYKKIVVLVNENTQSSAEVMAAVLKKYNVGVLVGTPTKGWGTVEKVFPLENQLGEGKKHSVFLVHSLTLREDSQPIQDNKVQPVVNINDNNWEEQLLAYFDFPPLVAKIREIYQEE